MTTPRVTVIVNCFNGDAFLRDAIDSVIAQTWINWEIIFWDNQSTDKSAAIIKSYNDPRIHYHYAPRHTMLSEARNNAIAKATGEFIAFLDVDDWWLPKKIEQQLAEFNDPEVAFVYGNFWMKNERRDTKKIAFKKQLPQGKILDSLLNSYQVGLLTLVIRRSVLPKSHDPFDPRYHIIGDFDLVLRLAATYKANCVQSPVAVYRVHVNNESFLRRETYIAEMLSWCREMTTHAVIGKSMNYRRTVLRAEYIQAVGALRKGDRQHAIKLFSRSPFGWIKLRLLLAILLPKPIFDIGKR